MRIRPKLLLVITVLGFVPVLVLGVMMYRETMGAVESHLRTEVERAASGIALSLEAELKENEAALSELARSPALRAYVHSGNGTVSSASKNSVLDDNSKTQMESASLAISEQVKESVRGFLLSGPGSYSAITCIGTTGKVLFRAEPGMRDQVARGSVQSTDVKFKVGDAIGGEVKADARVWTQSDQSPLRSPLAIEPNAANLRYTVPIFAESAAAGVPRGALLAELNGNALLDDAMTGHSTATPDASGGSDSTPAGRFIIVLEHDGDILYYTNELLRHQKVDAVLSSFVPISQKMLAGDSGWEYFDKDGSKWIVAYRPMVSTGMSVGAGGNLTAATARVKRTALITFILFSLLGLVTIGVLAHMLRLTSRSIERVTEGAVAIAGGRLEQRIEVRSNDETRVLAESFNIMTDRLRDQISRESESRQFESFMRLSAMLTHDLKNAIAGLSLLVGNIGKKFHREEFRADAMTSLTEATDKLRNLVAKLSEPMQSLSSEHQMARPTDLVPIIRKALATSVEPTSDLHKVVIDLPTKLIATVEPDRIEKVFENLVINAIEAMGSKPGKLTIIAGETEQAEVFVTISDTGPGISADFQRLKLFRPFSTTKKTGIGLGLYACREILNAHRGRIEVTSIRGSGATFRVVLPSTPTITKRA